MKKKEETFNLELTGSDINELSYLINVAVKSVGVTDGGAVVNNASYFIGMLKECQNKIQQSK